MDQQLLLNVVISLVGPGSIGLIILAIIKLRENRTTLKFGYEAQQHGQDARWNAAYRAGAEAHLPWDVNRLGEIHELQSFANFLLKRLGEPEREYTPIPPAPPLFPESLSQEVKV